MNKEYEILQSSKVSRASGFIAIFLIIFYSLHHGGLEEQISDCLVKFFFTYH